MQHHGRPKRADSARRYLPSFGQQTLIIRCATRRTSHCRLALCSENRAVPSRPVRRHHTGARIVFCPFRPLPPNDLARVRARDRIRCVLLNKYEARAVFATSAARRRTAEQSSLLRGAAATDDNLLFLRVDRAFNQCVAESSANHHLVKAIAAIHALARRFLVQILSSIRSSDCSDLSCGNHGSNRWSRSRCRRRGVGQTSRLCRIFHALCRNRQ